MERREPTSVHFNRVLFALLACGLVVSHAYAPKTSGNQTFPTDFYGVDVSEPVSATAFTCLKSANLQFAVIRCYQSLGRVDPACAASAAAAHDSGMIVHAYMFPCPTCGDPEGQVASLLSYFTLNRVNVTRMWLDIEGAQYWTASVRGMLRDRSMLHAPS
jgi:hypothetical protein